MLKGETIYLRLFEPGDYEKTYVWRNDYELQKNTCGPFRQVSKAIEKAWVEKMANNNQKDIYLAICLIENDEMIGYYSINDIDLLNRKCVLGGIIIGDKNNRDGTAYLEVGPLALDYVFNHLNMNRASGACLKEHVMSRANMEARGYTLEGIERQSVFKDGKYHDVYKYAILREDYLSQKKMTRIELTKKIVLAAKRIKKEL